MTLFKIQLKYNWKAWVSITALCLVYVTIFIATSKVMESIDPSEFPEGMFTDEDIAMLVNPMTMLSSFFSSIYSVFAIVFICMFTSKAYTKPMETTSMSCYLSLPISRIKYSLSMSISYAISVFVLGALMMITGVIGFMVAGFNIDYGIYIDMVAVATLQCASVGFIALLLASGLAGGKWAKILATAVPIALWVLPTFADMADWLKWLSYLTPYGWINFTDLSMGNIDLLWVWYGVYIAIITVCLSMSCVLFKRRQLPI
jgi:ABC-type transport system involved in multi-copper enzyme maturation permease subunit